MPDSTGQYRNLAPPPRRSKAELATLRRELGVAHPTEDVSVRPALRDVGREWYEKTLLSRRTTTTRIRGRVHPKAVTVTEERNLTVGMALGAAALLLGWEVGQSIAHGLAGLNPSAWVDDIESWIEGTPTSSPSLAENSVGGIIESRLVEILSPATAPAHAPAPAPSPVGGGTTAPPPPYIPPAVPPYDLPLPPFE